MIIKAIHAADTLPIRRVVMWPEKPIEFVKIQNDDDALHYGLYKNSQLVSVISCFEANGELQFRKFATLMDMQGQGLGTHLLNYVLANAKAKGIKRVWCNARFDKKFFYEKFGLTQTVDRFIKEGIEFIVMELVFE